VWSRGKGWGMRGKYKLQDWRKEKGYTRKIKTGSYIKKNTRKRDVEKD